MPDAADAQPLDQAYGHWVAPKYDGALMIWPEAATLADVAEANRRQLDAAAVTIHGRALPEWRQIARAFVGHRAEAPLVATGHQCELHHPGVWVKNTLINAVAEKAGGEARCLHLAVDLDAPKHLKLKWPGFEAPITDDDRIHSAAWSGLLDPPTPAHLATLESATEAAVERGLASPLLLEFLANCRRYLIDQRDSPSPMSLAGMMADAEHRIDWELGLRHDVQMLSGLLGCEAWAALVCHLAADADGFADAYNAALKDYREEFDLVGTDRPMPDLAIEDDTIELPLWVDNLAVGRRGRARVRRAGNGFALEVDGKDLGFSFDSGVRPQQLLRWLRHHQLRLAPRALSLTLFTRLFVSDLFVHGIGGGHYDNVLDRILRSYFNMKPPTFAVATATLLHPGAADRERPCLSCLKREGHHLRHTVLENKQAWLAQIAAEPDFFSRRAVFEEMHAARRSALQTDEAVQAWRRRWREAQQLEAENEVWFDRELFYLLQPRDRLANLIARVQAQARDS